MEHVALELCRRLFRFGALRRVPRLLRALQKLLRHLVVVHVVEAVPQQHEHLQRCATATLSQGGASRQPRGRLAQGGER